ncbi:FGGY-family carbohydrate kinase, partial [uncultured Thiocystis sp.]
VGGGASNPTWTRMRARLLGLEVVAAEHREAAFGAARLALRAFDTEH